MAKVQPNKMEEVRLELNRLMVQYVITKDESLTALINDFVHQC